MQRDWSEVLDQVQDFIEEEEELLRSACCCAEAENAPLRWAPAPNGKFRILIALEGVDPKPFVEARIADRIKYVDQLPGLVKAAHAAMAAVAQAIEEKLPRLVRELHGP